MRISVHQPAYLPWLGYLEKIKRSDVFVFLDTVQFEKNSFINRNKIKTPQGALWLTIPVLVKGHTQSNLSETRIDSTQAWKDKHLKTIQQNYRKAPFFEANYPKLQQLYQRNFDFLSDLCFEHLLFWLQELQIQSHLVRSSNISISGDKSDLILNLCQHFSATHYLSGALGKNYLEEKKFKEQGIQVEYQNFLPTKYPQLYGNFIPCLSILDAWMNVSNTEFSSLN
ncbi:MAG: WbqC family protein [Deltaproteobacteria bacterium]|nr:WbqC family protein [Deltaproteobacteria bacterium]